MITRRHSQWVKILACQWSEPQHSSAPTIEDQLIWIALSTLAKRDLRRSYRRAEEIDARVISFIVFKVDRFTPEWREVCGISSRPNFRDSKGRWFGTVPVAQLEHENPFSHIPRRLK